MAKRKGLGRGLDALLGTSVNENVLEPGADGELRMLPVERLHRGKYQPRAEIDPEALDELTRSVRAQGVVQPIVVRADDDGASFEIIAGERRWRAAQGAGLAEIPAIVRCVDDETALALSLIENIQREDLNPIEEARALQRLIEEFAMTHELAAEAVGRSRSSITNLLRLLELNADVRSLVERGGLNMGHARALLGLSGLPQSEAASVVVDKGLSARETEALVRRRKSSAETASKPARGTDPDVRRLEESLATRLSAPVRIQCNAKGKGSLTIRYSTLEELDGILERIR